MTHRREWKLDNPTHLITCAVALLFFAAGIIHLSAASDHGNLPFMMVGFIVVALAQMGLAALLFLRGPSVGLLAVGLVLTLASVAVWLLSRTIGLPFLEGGHMEPIGFKDGVTVLFELATLPGLFALFSPFVRDISLPAQVGRQALTGLAAGIALMFVPALLLGGGGHHSQDELAALSAGHEHGGSEHDHGEESGEAAEDDDHDQGEAGHEDHEHGMSEDDGQTLSGGDHSHELGSGALHIGPDASHSGHDDSASGDDSGAEHEHGAHPAGSHAASAEDHAGRQPRRARQPQRGWRPQRAR